MYLGKTLFAQVMDFLPWKTFHRIVNRYGGDRGVRTLSCAEQFRVMAFAQLTYRESLRDIEVCLAAQAGKLYHMGIAEPVARSTLADANESRDWRIYLRIRTAIDHQGTSALRGRGLRGGADQYRVCARCHDHRSVPVDVPVGAVSLHQGRSEAAHAAGPARLDPHLHPHLRWQAARCERSGPDHHRGGRLLHHGSGLPRLRAALRTGSGGRVLRHACQAKPRCTTPVLGAGGSQHRTDQRPDHRSERLLRRQALPRRTCGASVTAIPRRARCWCS